MTNSLTTARAALKDALEAALTGTGVTVFSTVPERVVPPFVAIAPGDPYVEYEGAVFGGKRVRLSAVCVVDPGTNDKQAEALDDLVVLVADAIDALSPGFAVQQVQQPGQVSINNQAHLGASVLVLTEV